MMDYGFTEEQQAIQALAREIAENEIRPVAAEYDRTGEFPWPVVKTLAQADLFRTFIPEQYEGIANGTPTTNLVLVTEELSKACGGIALALAGTALGTMPILISGGDELKQRFLPDIASGKRLAAFALTEPDAGSDAGGIRTTAIRDGDHYVLNGTKQWITNGGEAEVYTVIALTNPAKGPRGASAIVVEKGTPGFTFGKKEDKMGIRASATRELSFEDCRVPVANRLGREGRGLAIFECSMEWERGCILASCLGVMRRQLEEVIVHARSRKQFGQPIGKYQSVANRIVDMKVRLDTCRPLVYRIGRLKEQGQSAVMEAAIAKLYVSECLVKSSLDAVQLYGGYGYMTEQQVERDLRDAVGSTLYSGTSEIQRNIIAKSLGL